MAALDVTKKLHVYHILYRLNISFANIVKNCQLLRDAEIFRAKDAWLYQGYAQELQSEINEVSLEIMHDIEFGDWTRFGKIRKAKEKEISDPDDVFIQAAERRRELKRIPKKRSSTKTS